MTALSRDDKGGLVLDLATALLVYPDAPAAVAAVVPDGDAAVVALKALGSVPGRVAAAREILYGALQDALPDAATFDGHFHVALLAQAIEQCDAVLGRACP